MIVYCIKKSAVTNAQQYGLNIFVFDSVDSKLGGKIFTFLSSCLILHFGLLFRNSLLEKHAKCVGWKQMVECAVTCLSAVLSPEDYHQISVIHNCCRRQFQRASLCFLINLFTFTRNVFSVYLYVILPSLSVFLCRYGFTLYRIHFKCVSLSSRGFWTVSTSHSFALVLYLEPYALR